MPRGDLLWAGLKVLGAFLLVSGASQAGSGAYDFWAIGAREGGVADAIWRAAAYRELIAGGITAVGGLALALGAGWVAPPPPGGQAPDAQPPAGLDR